MKKTIIACAVLIATSLSIHAQSEQSEKKVQSTLKAATIMRVGAELEHAAKASLSSGNNELVIEGLSASIDANSLQIKCSGGVTVMSSEFTKDYLSATTPSAAAKALEDSIVRCNKELTALRVALATNKELRELLQGNKSIAGSQTGLKVEELTRMMDYYRTKSIELETEKSNSEEKTAALQLKLKAFNSQLDQEKRKNDKMLGRLKLKLASPLAGMYDFTVAYYTPSAYWLPYYDLQATSSDKPVKLISKAKFMQTTGLDWKKVALTLSTSTPNNGKTAPVLSAWFLNYLQAYRGADFNQMELTQNSISYDAKEMKKDMLSEVVVTGYGTASPSPVNVKPVYILNGNLIDESEFQSINPDMIENINVLKGNQATSLYGSNASGGAIEVKLKDNFVSESETESDITYNIDLPYDVLGTGTEQSVILRTIDLPATYEYYCVPKVDKTVYLLAGVKDWTKYNLLPGEANITYAGTYSGKSYIDPNSTKDILHLTLGNDKRIAVKREKMQDFSSTKFLGNDREQVFTYQLTVKNNKNMQVNMILKDQYPISTDKSIVVKVLETSQAHINEDVGTLTWEFPLNPGETRTFKVSYSVRYPKDKNLNL